MTSLFKNGGETEPVSYRRESGEKATSCPACQANLCRGNEYPPSLPDLMPEWPTGLRINEPKPA